MSQVDQPNPAPAKRFRVAFSFPGEKRDYVKPIADLLAKRFGEERILYDRYHTAEFANPNLAFTLPAHYCNDSDLVVVVLCADYERKKWCGLEWRAIYSLIMDHHDRLVMLFRADDAEIAGLYGLEGSIPAEVFGTEKACELILQRLARNEDKPRDFYLKDSSVNTLPASRDAWKLIHPYAMPPHFTGRVAERAMLTSWLNGDAANPLLVLRALGGFGKSALVWHWLMHDVDAVRWPRVVWWGFYDDPNFDSFLERSVEYLQPAKLENTGPRQRLDALIDVLHESGTLLVLDGFERALRAFGGMGAAYQGDEEKPQPPAAGASGKAAGQADGSDRDCISPMAERFLRCVVNHAVIRGKVLLTTRLRPRPVEDRGELLLGCREEELRQMQPDDAIALFRAQKIRGTDAEIKAACEAYGYHPLSLRLLAGIIVRDLRRPGDVRVASTLDIIGDLVARKNHVLKLSYDMLDEPRQRLLGKLACFRGSVTFDQIVAVAPPGFIMTQSPNITIMSLLVSMLRRLIGLRASSGASEEKTPEERSQSLLTALHELVMRGLLHHERGEHQFDLHPIIRRYAYDRLSDWDRSIAHEQLCDYFSAVPKQRRSMRLEDLSAEIELFHHRAYANRCEEAYTQYRVHLEKPLYYQLGAYKVITDMLESLRFDARNYESELWRNRDHAWVLNALANCYSVSGNPRKSIGLYSESLNIDENQYIIVRRHLLSSKREVMRIPNKSSAIVRQNMAGDQLQIGAFKLAENSLREASLLGVSESAELGRLLAYRSLYDDAVIQLDRILNKQFDAAEGNSVAWAIRALVEILRSRSWCEVTLPLAQTVITLAKNAINCAAAFGRFKYPIIRDYVRSNWILGGAFRLAGQYEDADRQLYDALFSSRRINLVEFEADILIDLARLRAATGQADEALRLADEAREIAERCGYVLQGADAHLELGKLAKARGERAVALKHAREARRLATCDGPPDYTYHAAYVEAGRLLEELGEKPP